MLRTRASAIAIAMAFLIPSVPGAEQDADKKVAGGGITVKGWQGKIDAASAAKQLTINDSKFVAEGSGFRVTTGPPAVYWNPANTAKGDYTVKATFREPKQTMPNHPHPFGVFIAGSKLDTEQPSLIYCVAYRDGTFLIRQFGGGTTTNVVKRQPHAAVNKATGPEAEVTQEVGWTVKGNRADCVINGQVVGGVDRTDPASPAKLESTDGVYGVRVTHNSDVIVSGFGMSK